MTQPIVLKLPVGVRLDYLAEGGANIVYRFNSTPAVLSKPPKRLSGSAGSDLSQTDLPPELRGKLLRLRKETKSRTAYEETVQDFEKIIRPLFDAHELVDQRLVLLPSGLVQHCNEQLLAAELDGLRPKKRYGSTLSVNEPFGLLITDMTPMGDPKMTLAELKPKWLLQSPSAPAHARRCRTCALREMKIHEACGADFDEESQHSFCPLDLVSDKFEDVLRAAKYIKGCRDQLRLARVLYRNSTILRLRTHQSAAKEVGLLGPPAHSRGKSLAMTLRDCTMFIKVCKTKSILTKKIFLRQPICLFY